MYIRSFVSFLDITILMISGSINIEMNTKEKCLFQSLCSNVTLCLINMA